MNGQVREFAPAFTNETMQEIFGGNILGKYTRSREMSVNRTRGHALELYNKMYQIDPNMGLSLIHIFGRKALIANGLSFFIFGFYTVYSSLFLALGKGKEGFIIGSLRQMCIRDRCR